MGNITARTDVRDGVLDGAENGNGDEILLRRVMDVGGDGSAPRVEVMGDIPFKIIDLKPRGESADQESSLFFGNITQIKSGGECARCVQAVFLLVSQ